MASRNRWNFGYAGLETKVYQQEITNPSQSQENASKLMPRVHRVASLLKRWLLGTHQGGVAYYYLPYYLDEFTFRFNRRKSASRGKLFFRLMQQAVATSPRTHESMVRSAQPKPLSIGHRGWLSQAYIQLFANPLFRKSPLQNSLKVGLLDRKDGD
jgi:hypothetical protein